MRIIFIPGIKTWQFYLKGWKKDLALNFLQTEILFQDQIFYLHFEHQKLKKIVENTVKIINDQKPTIILAHSFGGILAKTAIDQAKKNNVKKLITLATPHRMSKLGVGKAKKFLTTPLNVNTETLTFGGNFDLIVPAKYTFTDNSIHQNFSCEHLGFMILPKIRKKIIQILKRSNNKIKNHKGS